MTQDTREDLKAYLDGELEPERAQKVRAAIEQDETLREEAEFMSLISASLRKLRPRREAIDEMAEIAVRKVARPRSSLMRIGWAWSGAAVLLIAGLFAWLSLVNPKGSSQSVEPKPTAHSPDFLSSEHPARDQAAPTLDFPGPSERAEAGAEPLPLGEGSAATRPSESHVSILERNIVWRGELVLRVVSVEKARDEVASLVRSWRGYIKSSSLGDSTSQTPRAELIIRVPVGSFEEAMSRLEQLGERVSGRSDSEDVTEQIVDIEARLRTMKAQEETYRQLLGQAKTVGQVIEVQDRLSALRADIESLEARSAKLKELSSLSTIHLTLIQRPSSERSSQSAGWASDAWANAVNGVAAALRALAVAAIFAFVWIPVWLPCGILLIALYRRVSGVRR